MRNNHRPAVRPPWFVPLPEPRYPDVRPDLTDLRSKPNIRTVIYARVCTWESAPNEDRDLLERPHPAKYLLKIDDPQGIPLLGPGMDTAISQFIGYSGMSAEMGRAEWFVVYPYGGEFPGMDTELATMFYDAAPNVILPARWKPFMERLPKLRRDYHARRLWHALPPITAAGEPFL